MTERMEGLRAGLERFDQIGQVEGQALALTLRTGLLCERVAQLSMDNDQLKCALRNLKDSFRVGSERLSSRNAYLEGVGQEHADLQARVKSSLQAIAESLLDEMGRLDSVWGTDVDSDVDGARAQVRARIEAYAESLIDEVVRIDMFLESGQKSRVGESASGSCPEKSSSDGLASQLNDVQEQVEEQVEEQEIATPTPHTTTQADILAMQELVEAALVEAGESHRQNAELTARVHLLEGVKVQVARLQSSLKETRLQLSESQAKSRNASDHWRRERELLIKENSAIADRARVHSSKAEKRSEHVVQQLEACKKQLAIAMRENAAGWSQVAAASAIGERNVNLQRKLDLEAQLGRQLRDELEASKQNEDKLTNEVFQLNALTQSLRGDLANIAKKHDEQLVSTISEQQSALHAKLLERDATIETQAVSLATVVQKRDVALAALYAEKEALLKQLEALKSSGSEAAAQLTAQLAEKDKALTASRESAAKQAADSQKAAAREKEALLKQISETQKQLDVSKVSGLEVAEQLRRVESELISARASLSSVDVQLKIYADKEQHDSERLRKFESELALKIGELRDLQSEGKLTCISEVAAQSASPTPSAAAVGLGASGKKKGKGGKAASIQPSASPSDSLVLVQELLAENPSEVASFDAAKAESDSLAQQNAALQKEFADSQKAAAREKEALLKQLEALKSSGSEAAAQLTAQLAEKDKALTASRESAAKQAADSQKAAAREKEALLKQISETQKQLDVSKVSGLEVVARMEDMDRALMLERKAMADTLKAAENEKESLQKEVSETQKRLESLLAIKSNEISHLLAQLAEARETAASDKVFLQNQLAEEDRAFVDAQKSAALEIEALQSQLVDKDTAWDALHQQLADANKSVLALQNQLAYLSEDYRSLREALVVSRADHPPTEHLGDEEQALLQGISSTREALKLQLKQLDEDGSHAKTSPEHNLVLMALQEELKDKDSSIIKARDGAVALDAEIAALNRAAEETAASHIDSENEAAAQFQIRISYLETELLKKTADLVAFVELQAMHKRLQSKHEALEYEREAYRAEMLRVFEAEQKERERNSGPTVASPAKSAEIVTSFVNANQELQSLNRELLKKVASYETAEHDARDTEERWARCLDDERAHSKHLLACLEAAQLATAANDEEFAAQRQRIEQLERELRGRR